MDAERSIDDTAIDERAFGARVGHVVDPVRGRPGPLPWVSLGVAASGCVALALVDPLEHQVTPTCPFRALTGWWCPFCGGTRAVAKLVRGDVVSALRYNALFLIAIPLVVVGWWAWALPGRWSVADSVAARAGSSRAFWTTVMAVGAAFIVVRNVAPLDAWLRYPGA